MLAGDYLLARASEEASPLVPYAAELARGCYAHIGEIDRGLARVSENWALDRMPGSDRNLLRLAVYELRFSPEHVGDAVVINEAVEIAKAYGTDESASFVNGVLGRVVRDSRIFRASLIPRLQKTRLRPPWAHRRRMSLRFPSRLLTKLPCRARAASYG